MGDISTVMGGVLLLGLYILPAYIGREKRQARAIFWVNLLLGWTVIGWMAALIWATRKDA